MKIYCNENGKSKDAEWFKALQNSTQAIFKYTIEKDVIYFKICVVLKSNSLGQGKMIQIQLTGNRLLFIKWGS